jgi:hypothetical protein
MDEHQSLPVLLSALREAARAHGVYEETELAGVYDENWPEWYARHMARTLAERGFELTEAQTAVPPTMGEAPT